MTYARRVRSKIPDAPATLPHCLLRNAMDMPRRPAFREKRGGIWQELSWGGYAERVRRIAYGLAAQGFAAGGRLSAWGENRACLYAATLAAQALGGAGVPLHPDAEMAQVVQILRDSTVSFVLTETTDQAERLIAIRERLPHLRRIVTLDTRGRPEASGILHSLTDLEDAGRAHAVEHPGLVDASIAAREPGETALLLYSWPMRHLSRPLVASHANLLAVAGAIARAEAIRRDDEAFCYLPLCSIEDAVYSQALGLLVGFARNCPEGPDSVPRDLREIGPTFLFAPCAVVAALAAQIESRARAASPLKRRLFARFCATSEATGRAAAPFAARLVWEVVIGGPVRDQLGLRRTRWIHLGEGALPPAIVRRFSALGVPLRPAPPLIPALRPAEIAHA